MDTHNLLTLQYAFVKGHIHISNSNKLRDFTHATLSPYGKHHACPHTTAYNVPDDPPQCSAGERNNNGNSFWCQLTWPVCALVIPLKGLQIVPSQLGKCVHHMGAQKGTDVLWNKSAISGAVLGPVHIAAHASTAAWNQICFEFELHCFKNEPCIVFCLLIGSVWTHRSKYTYAGRRVKNKRFLTGPNRTL